MSELLSFVKFKKRENTHRRVILLVNLQDEACSFTKSNTPTWVFFTFLSCTNSTNSRKVSHLLNVAFN